ncbi:MAG: IS21 family transposase [Planctomycetales bacterium]|nr:IS21 family transposase [Planctomycetales bacterium]
MSNHLAMDKVQAVQQLVQAGWSQRKISEAVGVDRKTIRRLLQQAASKGTSAPSEAPTGLIADAEASKGTTSSSQAPTGPPAVAQDAGPTCEQVVASTVAQPSRSTCQAFHELIVAALQQRLTAKRIYQDLVVDHGFTGSYWAVNRYVKCLEKKDDLPFRRLETAPGYEAQIDFGKGAPYLDSSGKKRRCHVLRFVLSFSRKAYSEVVPRQTTDCFLNALENAFVALGGVPRTLVVDNLKAAVLKADWFDPELNPKIIDFCRHYNTAILPTKPRMPRHKGKVERGVGYVQDNALKGRVFDSLSKQNEYLVHWERTVADTRIHGTTKQHVGKLYQEVERAALQSLPLERFPSYEEAQRKVARDGHIEVAKSYYSMPPEYCTHVVWARWDGRTVRVFNRLFEQIAYHPSVEPGKYSTHPQHIASQKINGVERGIAYHLEKISYIGPQAARWSQAMLEQRGIPGARVLQGLLSLTQKHCSAEIESACETAWKHQLFHLGSLKRLIGQQVPQQQLMEFTEDHWLIRPAHEYAQFVHDVIQGGCHTHD